MSTTTIISVRMDSDLKAKAEALFADLGLNMSTAINIFVRQAVREDRIPFEIARYSPSERAKKALAEAESIRNSPSEKGFTDLEELFKSLRE